MDVSVRTLKRRLRDMNIRMRDKYSSISDTDLDGQIYDILQRHPTIGITIDFQTS